MLKLPTYLNIFKMCCIAHRTFIALTFVKALMAGIMSKAKIFWNGVSQIVKVKNTTLMVSGFHD